MDMVRLHVRTINMTTIYALELQIRFISDMFSHACHRAKPDARMSTKQKRSAAYSWYAKRASQVKIGYGAKSTSLATSLAGQQTGVVREL